MVYSGKNRITGTANKVNIDALTTVSERIDFLLCQSQDHPVSHKTAQEAKPLKIKGCQRLFVMFILKHGLAIQILGLSFSSVVTTSNRLFL